MRSQASAWLPWQQSPPTPNESHLFHVYMISRFWNPSRAPQNTPSVSTSLQALEEILEAVQNNSLEAGIRVYWRLIWQCQKKEMLRFWRVSQVLPSTVGVGLAALGWWSKWDQADWSCSSCSERGCASPCSPKVCVFQAWQNLSPSSSSPASHTSGPHDLLLGPLPCLRGPDGRIIFVLCRKHCFPNGS